MMAAAQHLKAASTAPIAMTSVGSRLRGAARRSSSNSWRWYTAASASRAICKQPGQAGQGHGVWKGFSFPAPLHSEFLPHAASLQPPQETCP